MRLNIYGNELGTDAELVTKYVADDGGERILCGLRVYFGHSFPKDAVTFWVPQDSEGANKWYLMRELLQHMVGAVGVAEMRELAVAAEDKEPF